MTLARVRIHASVAEAQAIIHRRYEADTEGGPFLVALDEATDQRRTLMEMDVPISGLGWSDADTIECVEPSAVAQARNARIVEVAD